MIAPSPPRPARAFTQQDVDLLEDCIDILNKMKEEFSKYPGQADWFLNFLWFLQYKFQFFKHIIKIDDYFFKMSENCKRLRSNNFEDEVYVEIRKALINFQDLADFFYTLDDINDIKIMSKLQLFYGYHPHIQYEIYTTLFYLMTDLRAHDNINQLSDKLNTMSHIAGIISDDVFQIFNQNHTTLQLSQKVSAVISNCEDISDLIKSMKKIAKPFNVANSKIAKILTNAKPLTKNPELHAPIDPNKVVNQFYDKFSKWKISGHILKAFHTVWLENNGMSLELLNMMEIEKYVYNILKKYVEYRESREFQVINLCFRWIMVIIYQLPLRLNRFNDKIYKNLTTEIIRLPKLRGKYVLDVIRSSRYDYRKYFSINGYDCDYLVKDVVDTSEKMALSISSIMRSSDNVEMIFFEKQFVNTMEKLKIIQSIVIQKTEYYMN